MPLSKHVNTLRRALVREIGDAYSMANLATVDPARFKPGAARMHSRRAREAERALMTLQVEYPSRQPYAIAHWPGDFDGPHSVATIR